jgi:hypothetical protein
MEERSAHPSTIMEERMREARAKAEAKEREHPQSPSAILAARRSIAHTRALEHEYKRELEQEREAVRRRQERRMKLHTYLTERISAWKNERTVHTLPLTLRIPPDQTEFIPEECAMLKELHGPGLRFAIAEQKTCMGRSRYVVQIWFI